jgi:AcrR family transcriptional regulator
MRPDTAETRARLIATAEQLYAERGLDGVSLVEISREAGQRNRAAAQYHFTDKAGLVQAILDKHTPGIEAARHAMIDALEAGTGEPPLRAWVDALVRPLAAKLDDEDGGRAFLRVQAELMRQPDATLEHRAKQNRGAERLLRGMTRATTAEPSPCRARCWPRACCWSPGCCSTACRTTWPAMKRVTRRLAPCSWRRWWTPSRPCWLRRRPLLRWRPAVAGERGHTGTSSSLASDQPAGDS